MKRRLGLLAGTGVLLALAACSGMSGLGGDSNYACKAPAGVACDSVSGTYANAMRNNLPGQRRMAAAQVAAGQDPDRSRTATPPPAHGTDSRASSIAAAAPPPVGTPLRSQARVLRLWIKPWEDADGDLFDQGYVYVQIDPGRWQLDYVQRRIRDTYAPLRPPANLPADDRGAAETQQRPSASGNGLPRPLTPARAGSDQLQ